MPNPVSTSQVRPRTTRNSGEVPVVRSTPGGRGATALEGIVQEFDAPPLAQQQSRVMPTHPHQHLGAAAPYHGLHPSPRDRLGK